MSVVLTGSTGTLASLYAKQVAAKDPTAHLVLFVRQVNKVPAGVLPPRSAHVEYRSLDLTDLGAVRAAAKQLAEDVKTGKVPPIKALVLSAAIQHAGAEQPYFTADGYEETMAVNHLAHYALIRELIRSLDPKAARGKSRLAWISRRTEADGTVIIVGSATHSSTYAYFTRKADLKPLDELLHPTPGCDPPAESLEYGQQRYGTSKLAQVSPTPNPLCTLTLPR